MKKNPTKLFMLLICCILLTGCLLIFPGCSSRNGTSGTEPPDSSSQDTPLSPNENITITLSNDTLEMIVGDYKQLFVSYSKVVNDITLEWESDNEQVAKVNNGVVEAISEGTATIKAKYGNAEAVCQVNVSFGEELPTLLGTVNDFCVCQGDEYTFAPSVLFNNRRFEDGEFTYTSSDSEVLTMDGSVLTAVKTGKAQVVIKGSWRGKTVESAPSLQIVVSVEVVDELSIYFVTDETETDIEVDVITLEVESSIAGATTKNSENIYPVVYKNGILIEDIEYSVINSNPDVVEYDPVEKTVTAKSFGVAVLTVEMLIEDKIYSKTLAVEAIRLTTVLENDIKYFSAYTGMLKAEGTLEELTVIEYILGSNEVEIVDAYQDGRVLDVQNNRILGVAGDAFDKVQTTLTIGTATDLYQINTTVYGIYITKAEELEIFVLNKKKTKVNLYVELGCDIQAQDYTLPTGNLQITSKKEAEGFTGVFNGNGFAIRNLTLQSNQGLFGAVTKGFIRNVAFINWSYVDGFSQASGILGVNLQKAKLDNVYVKINKLPKANAGANILASYKIFGGSFRCVYIEYTEDIGTVTYDNCYSALGAIMPNEIPTFENCIIVSKAPIGVCKTEKDNLQVAIANNVNIETSKAIADSIKTGYATNNGLSIQDITVTQMELSGVRAYDTLVDMQKDYINTATILSAFSKQYWTISENKLLWGVNSSEAVEGGTIRLDLGLVKGKQIQGLQTVELKANAGNTVQLPTNLVCMGYIFKGWSYMGEMIENGQIVNYNGVGMTVVAVWEKDPNYIQTPII